MVIDTFIEWLVIAFGALLVLGVLFPSVVTALGRKIEPPHPTKVRIWLSKFGL